MPFFKNLQNLLPIFKFQIVGNSMYPAFKSQETILVSRVSYFFSRPSVNDVIVVKDPRGKKYLIKRIKKIQEEKYFVVGDNTKESSDSRVFGWISKKEVLGKVWHKIK